MPLLIVYLEIRGEAAIHPRLRGSMLMQCNSLIIYIVPLPICYVGKRAYILHDRALCQRLSAYHKLVRKTPSTQA